MKVGFSIKILFFLDMTRVFMIIIVNSMHQILED